MSQSSHNRQIDYIEFKVADILVAKAFYERVFGWTFTDYGPEYTSFHDGRLSGGFWQGPPASGKGPLVVIYATDLEDVENAVPAAGGTDHRSDIRLSRRPPVPIP